MVPRPACTISWRCSCASLARMHSWCPSRSTRCTPPPYASMAGSSCRMSSMRTQVRERAGRLCQSAMWMTPHLPADAMHSLCALTVRNLTSLCAFVPRVCTHSPCGMQRRLGAEHGTPGSAAGSRAGAGNVRAWAGGDQPRQPNRCGVQARVCACVALLPLCCCAQHKHAPPRSTFCPSCCHHRGSCCWSHMMHAGQCLSKANQADVVRFCELNGLVLIADEVYQVGGSGA